MKLCWVIKLFMLTISLYQYILYQYLLPLQSTIKTGLCWNYNSVILQIKLPPNSYNLAT